MSSDKSQVQSASWKLLLARLAWGVIVLLCFVVIVISEFISLQNGSQEWLVVTSYQAVAHLLSFQAYFIYLMVIRHLIFLLFIGTAILVIWRRKEDWMALLVSITLILLPVTFFFGNISQNSLIPAPWDVIFSNLEMILVLSAIGCLVALFSSFPDGVFKPAWLFPFMTAAFILILILFRASESNENYWAAAVLTFSFVLLVSVSAQIHRYRKNTSRIYRQQIKWVLFAFFMMAVTFPTIMFLSLVIKNEPLLTLISLHIQLLVIPLIPLSFAVAILRYRLFDIDLIIRRTLQYTLLAGLLALVYFSGVVLLQSILTLVLKDFGPIAGDYYNAMESQQGLAPPAERSATALNGQPPAATLVLSTLAVAALFNPLRRRIQEFIDRRFYRQKYDAEKALALFADAARSETDLVQLSNRLTTAVKDTLQPQEVSLWLKHHKNP